MRTGYVLLLIVGVLIMVKTGWLTMGRLDLIFTIFLACCTAIVVFECGFKAMRDFGGFND